MPGKIQMAKVVLQITGWLAILSGAAFLLMSVFGSVIIGTSVEENSVIGSLVVGVMGFVMTVIAVAVGVLCLMTAKGVVNKKNWAKVVGIVLGILYLPGFPVGTVLGVLILVGLLSSESQGWFQPAA
jgi:uncharacterized membrane protein (DUF2068 family)